MTISVRTLQASILTHLQHSSNDDQFNVIVENKNYPIVQVNVYCDSAEVTREITVPYPILASVSAPTTPTSASTTNVLPSSASVTAVPSGGSGAYGISGAIVIQGLPITTDESSV